MTRLWRRLTRAWARRKRDRMAGSPYEWRRDLYGRASEARMKELGKI